MDRVAALIADYLDASPGERLAVIHLATTTLDPFDLDRFLASLGIH